MEHEEILSLKINSDDFDSELTIRGYLESLLTELWAKGESFSGKRPFGNSGWEYDIYKPLIEAGVVKGELDSDGYIEELDTKEADSLVFSLIRSALKA